MANLVASLFAVTMSHTKQTVGLYSIKIYDDTQAELVKMNLRGESSIPIGSKSEGQGVYIDGSMCVYVGDTKTSTVVALFGDLAEANQCFLLPNLRTLDPRWKFQTESIMTHHSNCTPGFRYNPNLF